jgi:hypothetical protein
MRDTLPMFSLALIFACGPAVDVAPTDDTGSTGEVSSTSDSSSTTAVAPGSAATTAATSADPGPGSESSSSTIASGEDTGASESTASEPGHYTVSGTVTRSVEPMEGNDGVGPMYIAIVSTCDFVFDLVAADVVLDADPGRGAAWQIAAVPEGTWYFIAFLDDDEDAELPSPMPDRGDLVAGDGGGIGCAEFTVDGADVTGVDLDLDFVMP